MRRAAGRRGGGKLISDDGTHLVSWLTLLAVPVASLLFVLGWLPQPFGDLGMIGDVFLIIVAIVFVHGIARASTEEGTGL
jgi:hypothetical protein